MEFFKLSSIKILSALLFMSQLCACGVLDPYIDRRRNPGTSNPDKLYVGQSKPDAPAVCYNPLLSDMESIQKIADEECAKHDKKTHAEFVNKNNFSCKVLLPTTAFYKCVK